MPKNRLPLIAFVLTLGLGAAAIAQDIVADPAITTMSTDQLIQAREAAMKDNGRVMRGAGSLTGDAAVAAATTVLQNFTNLAQLFPEGSQGNSKALPIIWEQKDAFDAILAKATTAAGAMLVAAQAGDTAAYGTALRTIGGTCNECHDTYQKPRG
ncbi:MAG: cytochrome c [Hyphomicrobiales bacterium]|nr:MAG: cytochrome c [Hyphomicrobiales bacterium]